MERPVFLIMALNNVVLKQVQSFCGQSREEMSQEGAHFGENYS